MEHSMASVVMHNVVSVDGFIADENDDVGPLFEWYFNGDQPLAAGEMDEPAPGGFRVSRASYDYVQPTWDAIGVLVIGRHLFDMTNGWEGRPPTGEHVVVVSHRPKPDGWHPEASYHFVDDVTAAVDQAKELAGERTVAVAAGEVGGLGDGMVVLTGATAAPSKRCRSGAAGHDAGGDGKARQPPGREHHERQRRDAGRRYVDRLPHRLRHVLER
jgi:dihydrofolate reductase